MRSVFSPCPTFTVVLAVTGALCAFPCRGGAQETAAATLVPARRSITFNIDGSSGSFGVWKMRSERTNVGLLVDARIDYRHSALEGDDNDRTDSRIVIGIGPELRRYTGVAGRVGPYGFIGGRIDASYQLTSAEPDFEEDGWGAGVSARGGLGADFFPVSNLSIGAQTGVGATLRYRPLDAPTGDASETTIDLFTFGASLGGAIWF